MAATWISVIFVEPGRVPDPVAPDFHPAQVMWTADADPAARAAIMARNAQVAAALARALPGLEAQSHNRLDAEALEIVADDDLPPEAVLERLGRWKTWAAPGSGPVVRVELSLYDGMAELDVVVGDPARAARADVAAWIDRIAGIIAQGTGMQAWDFARRQTVKDRPGEWLLARMSDRLDRSQREEWLVAVSAKAAPVVAVLVTLLWLVAMAATARIGLESGRIALATRDAPVADFITEATVPIGSLLLLPNYALIGTVGQEPVRLPVSRAEYIRAAPGARFSVLSTGDPATPFVLLSKARTGGPWIPLGAGRALPSGAAVVLVGLTVLWALIVSGVLNARRRGAGGVRRLAHTLGRVAVLVGLFLAALGVASGQLRLPFGL